MPFYAQIYIWKFWIARRAGKIFPAGVLTRIGESTAKEKRRMYHGDAGKRLGGGSGQ